MSHYKPRRRTRRCRHRYLSFLQSSATGALWLCQVCHERIWRSEPAGLFDRQDVIPEPG